MSLKILASLIILIAVVAHATKRQQRIAENRSERDRTTYKRQRRSRMLRRCRLIRVRPSNLAAGLFEIEQRPVFEDRLLGYALEVFGLFGRKTHRAIGLVGFAVDGREDHVGREVAARQRGVETILRIEHAVGTFGPHAAPRHANRGAPRVVVIGHFEVARNQPLLHGLVAVDGRIFRNREAVAVLVAPRHVEDHTGVG